MAVPGGFRPVIIDGMQYVDGALVENLPVGFAKNAFHADITLASDISSVFKERQTRNLFSIAARSLDIAIERRQWESRAEATVLVRGSSARSLADELAALGAVNEGELLSLPPAVAAEARPALAAAAAARSVSWSREPLTQGELLAGFARHCHDELDDVAVLEEEVGRLLLGWRDERARVELRWGALFAERLDGAPWLLLAPFDDALQERFLDDADLRGRVSVWDTATLTKLAAARTSVGVYFGWFLRDAYGVKVLPAQAFTAGLLARGIISLGM